MWSRAVDHKPKCHVFLLRSSVVENFFISQDCAFVFRILLEDHVSCPITQLGIFGTGELLFNNVGFASCLQFSLFPILCTTCFVDIK